MHELWEAINKELVIAIAAWVAAQLVKLIINLVTCGVVPVNMLLNGGGMPSSHSATVCGLATAVGFDCGLASPLFAVTCVFAFVVMYDAMGVRKETGDQGKAINRMMDVLKDMGRPIQRDKGDKRFKELVGHTPIQVFFGALLGIAVGVAMMQI